ncbi:MAG: xanthine dehydrogenase family protein subunit M [Roseovarius sp.]|nr:xanthine dehydrogenase family protein subunit M [Roseovarius sp.]MCY4209323.1 xanthine dehydrogenase family protein subunit M [Roseovarius sp.]MCY4316601.1 xanthine dehydrogenase family protein subunit M [Roseovarius sp.]
MIPSGFEYHRPENVSSAVEILKKHGDDARVIAGGHSLVPLMKLRMAEMAHLVDLQEIAELRRISFNRDNVVIGAMTTQAEIVSNGQLSSLIPILRETALLISDPQVRNMGTMGGNVAHGDPGNDMPAVMQCLDAGYTLSGPDGTRTVKARDFYESAYFTVRSDDEILTGITIPMPVMSGYAYEKQKRKIGDYAIAAAAVLIGDGKASVAFTNLSDTPVWSASASRALASGSIEQCVDCAMDAIEPQSDIRGPAEFKKHVAKVVLRRAIHKAMERTK